MCAARARHNNQYLRSSSLDSLVYLRPVADSSRVASLHLERFTRHALKSQEQDATHHTTPHGKISVSARFMLCLWANLRGAVVRRWNVHIRGVA
jgi:hypothetical protein